MTQTPGPRRLVGVADDYSRALDGLERRASANIVATIRRSMQGVLRSLRRSYALYLEDLGPQGFDPAGQSIRRPGSYSAAEATAKYRAILRDAQQFLTEEEIRVWSAGYERDLREASRLGGQLGTDLLRLVGRPDAAVPFTGADPLAIRAATLNTSAFIQGEAARFRDQLAQIVGEGATRGWGPKRLEVSIRQALRGAKDPNGITRRLGLEQRAALIARTELATAYSQGALMRARQEGFAYVRVLASNDERVCPTCASRNGRVYPVDRVPIPWHPRCVLGDTHVSPGVLAAVIRSIYRGNVVSIRLQSGERLSVTANHPVLTTTGWVKAEALRNGDQVVCHGLHRELPEVAEPPDLHQVPATAEDVFAAFSQASAVTTMRVPVAPLDLHGDGAFIEGDVDVVRAEGLLQGYRDPEASDALRNESGVFGCVRFRPLSALSHADAALLGLGAAANGSVRRFREALALLRGGLSHAEEHRIAAAAWRDPVLAQEVGDGVALHAEALGDGLDAGTLGECPECSSLVVNRAVAGEFDPSGTEATQHDAVGYPEMLRDLRAAHPGAVDLDEVVGVEVDAFHGFVYTFETFCGAYAIGQRVRVATRNCRCVATPVPDEAVQERDPDLRRTLLDADRWQAEHERGVEAYAEGQHKERVKVLRGQVDRAKDGDQKDTLSAQLERLIERGPDMEKARADLARALRTPTASEKRLYPQNPKPLDESVPLFD